MEQPSDEPDGRVNATRTTFRILEALRDGHGTVTSLANHLEVSKSTVHRHLSTLVDLNYVVRDDGAYRLGLNFLQLSESTRSSHLGRIVAKERTIELAHETEERALFVVEEQFEAVYLYRAGGRGPFRTDTMVGQRRPLHTLASGKAILSQWDDDRVEEYVEATDLEAMTDQTITDRTALLEEVERIRSRGYSFNDEEHRPGLRAVGLPVFGEDDTVLGAFSVFGPKGRLSGSWYREELPRILRDKADEMRIDLAYE